MGQVQYISVWSLCANVFYWYILLLSYLGLLYYIGSTVIEEISYLSTRIILINAGLSIHLITTMYIKINSWAYFTSYAVCAIWFEIDLYVIPVD